MGKWLYFSAMIAAVPIFVGAGWAQDVRLATEGGFPPFNFIDDDGEIAGFEREFGDEVCARAGLSCVWVLNDWDSMIPNLVAGNFDAILAGMGVTEERDELIDFTETYFDPAPSAYVALKENGADCDAGPVAVQTGSVQAGYLAETGADLVEVPTLEDALSLQRGGEVTTVFAGKPALDPFVEADAGQLIYVCQDVILGDGIGVGLRESDGDLRKALNSAILSLKDDGSLERLTLRWFEAEEEVLN